MSDGEPGPARRFDRVRVGGIWMDSVTFSQALDEIGRLVDAGMGGSVFTPNVDHVVQAERDPDLRAAYAGADLSLVDGTILLWIARALGTPLPEKISGSDLAWPLLRRAGAAGLRVYVLGGGDGVAARAASRIEAEVGLRVCGADAPAVLPSGECEEAAVERIAAARPDLLIVALGCPKQEKFIRRHRDRLRPAVALGMGAVLDFIAGEVRRAPPWMSRAGLEWFYRLSQEPRRLFRRYLIDDLQIARIFLREKRTPRGGRLLSAGSFNRPSAPRSAPGPVAQSR